MRTARDAPAPFFIFHLPTSTYAFVLLPLRANRSLRLINHDHDARKRFQGAAMRRLLVAFGLFASISGATAAEYELPPTLRGAEAVLPGASPCCPRWSGFYGGGQVSHSSMTADFGRGVSDLAAFIVRDSILEAPVSNFNTLPEVSSNAFGYGGFFGYNSQWEELILGWELNYTHTSLSARAEDSLSRIIADNTAAPPDHNFFYDVTVSGNAHVRVTDILMLRGRAGWTVGNFLPYAFLAPGIVRADVTRAATVSSIRTDVPNVTDPVTPPLAPVFFGPISRTDSKLAGYYFAYTYGLGLDVEVMPRVFVRLEYEGLHIPNIKDMQVSIQTLRTGIGLKF
jgi:outer membrane immunogenic protein